MRKRNPEQPTHNNKYFDYSYSPTKNDLVFLPLGGTNEIGMNLSLIGHDNEWLIIDCGLTFHDRLGIELLTADPSFIVHNQKKLNGILITHAHEDHIGAIEYLWPLLKCNVYTTPFAAAVLRQKLKEKSWGEKVPIIEVPFGKDIDIGKFSVEFFHMNHSIPEPSCLFIKTCLGTIVHTGDWTIDPAPLLGSKIDEEKLKEVGDKGVLAFLCDSTNIFTKEDTVFEKEVRENIIRIVKENAEKRITIACFSSNIARLETAMLAAKEAGRQVAIIGRSLQRMIAAAKESGYLQKVPKFIEDREAVSMPPEKVLFICTGSQGESRSALVRIASGAHQVVKMNDKDIVLFSSRVIPGNEKSIGELHSLLAKKNVDIITSSEENIHASGHPSCKSIKKMYEILRPNTVVPVHGEARHLVAQSHFAKLNKIKKVIVPNNGVLIQLAGENQAIIGEVKSGKWAVDGKRMIDFSNGNIIKERTKLAENGAIFVTLEAAKDRISNISLSIVGIVENDSSKDVIRKQIIQCINEAFKNADHISNDRNTEDTVVMSVKKMISQKLGKKPIVEVHIITS